MKINKKGFMLAEVVIVAAVISTLLVFLYISLGRMSRAYETRNRYYDTDAMYAAMEINKLLLKESFNYNEIQYYVRLLDNNTYQRIKEYTDFYSNNSYRINEAYYVKSDIVSLEQLNISFENDKNYFKEYINYLKNNISFDDYEYLIIIEIQKEDEDDLYYYTLKVGDTSETE